jgi:hypothetical protein
VTLQELLDARWADILSALGALWVPPTIAWGHGESPHFSSARGYATTIVKSRSDFYLNFSDKVTAASPERLDALVRHELGHVVDFASDAKVLDAWAAARGVRLARTPERRADTICEAVWGAPIFYDKEDVQTLRPGVSPRPARLGL